MEAERVSNLPKVTELIIAKPGFKSRQSNVKAPYAKKRA